VHRRRETASFNTESTRPPATDAIATVTSPTKGVAPHVGVSKPESQNRPPETEPLSRQGRKVADATLAAAKFKPTSDGKSAMRQFEVHGMTVTELVSAEKAAGPTKDGGKEET
jgi:hypothetical protein